MSAERRRLILGAAVVGVVALVLWMQFGPASQTATVAPARARNSRPAATTAEEPVRPLRLDSLMANRSEPDDAERNPFRFKTREAPAPSRAVGPITKEPDPLPAPVVPSGPPPPPQIPLKFLGVVVRQNGVTWAVLSDGKAPPVYGREGDIIDGRYRILKIGTESIELTYVDGKGRQTVRLTGQ